MGFRVEGVGFTVEGSRFEVWGLESSAASRGNDVAIESIHYQV